MYGRSAPGNTTVAVVVVIALVLLIIILFSKNGVINSCGRIGKMVVKQKYDNDEKKWVTTKRNVVFYGGRAKQTEYEDIL